MMQNLSLKIKMLFELYKKPLVGFSCPIFPIAKKQRIKFQLVLKSSKLSLTGGRMPEHNKHHLKYLIVADPGEIYVDPVNCVTYKSFNKIFCIK